MIQGQPQPPAGEIVLTYDDYLKLPDDGNRYEILEGVLYMTPAPVPRHQRVSRNLGFILHHFVSANNLGEVFHAPLDVIFSYTSIAQPDLIFMSNARQRLVTAKNIAGPPDLVVEITSPSTSERDRLVKAQLYARHGVDYYWLLDPETQTLDEYQQQNGTFALVNRVQGNATFTPRLFPGLEIDLGQVWA